MAKPNTDDVFLRASARESLASWKKQKFKIFLILLLPIFFSSFFVHEGVHIVFARFYYPHMMAMETCYVGYQDTPFGPVMGWSNWAHERSAIAFAEAQARNQNLAFEEQFSAIIQVFYLTVAITLIILWLKSEELSERCLKMALKQTEC